MRGVGQGNTGSNHLCCPFPLSLQNLTYPSKLSSDSASEGNRKCSLIAIDYDQSLLASIALTGDFQLVCHRNF